MAYKYISQVQCSDSIEFFQRLRDFLCSRNGTYDYSTPGIGWTLVDSSYAVDEDTISANDWFVVKTIGENSNFEFYIKFIYSASNIQTQAGMYWNTATHSMDSDIAGYNSNSMSITSTDVPLLGVYGNLDYVMIWGNKTSASTSPYLWFFGRLDAIDGISGDILTATSTYTSGSDISITFNESLPSDWVVGHGLFLWSDEGGGHNVTEIKTVNTETKTITVDLSNNLSNATVRASRQFSMCYSYYSGTAILNYVLLATDGVANRPISDKTLLMESNIYQGVSPDNFDGNLIACDVYGWDSTCGVAGKIPNTLAVSSSGTVPALFDMVDVNGDDYRILGEFNGSKRFAVLET